MKYLLLAIIILSSSCANRKTMVKRYIDEVVSVKQGSLITALTNSEQAENLTIGFKTIEYDTTGRIVRQTTGEIHRDRLETKKESVVKEDSVITQSVTTTKEEIKEKKSRSWQFIVKGIAAALLLIFIIYFLIRRAK